MSDAVPIEKDRSLPATIFYHYFRERPATIERYITLLVRLKEMGVFLIDICSEPVKVRGFPDGITHIINEIPKLRSNMLARGIHIADQDIVFLLARNKYKKYIQREFPDAQRLTWKYFRMCHLG